MDTKSPSGSVIELRMVFYTPPIQRPPMPVTPTVKDRSVLGVNRIGARERRDEGRERDGRSLRRRLMDLVMEEVETLPDLSVPQKERIRRNLDRFAEKHPGGATDLPPQPTLEQALDTVSRLYSEEDEEASSQVESAASRWLAYEMQRLLSLHTESATKIATYIHALMATSPDAHQVDIDA